MNINYMNETADVKGVSLAATEVKEERIEGNVEGTDLLELFGDSIETILMLLVGHVDDEGQRLFLRLLQKMWRRHDTLVRFTIEAVDTIDKLTRQNEELKFKNEILAERIKQLTE